MTATAVQQLPHPIKPRHQRRGRQGDRQDLVALQQVMMKLAESDDVQPHIRAQCARAWSDLQERKRIMDGKPLPGQLRPDLAQLKQRKSKPSLLPLPEVPSTTTNEGVVGNTGVGG